VLTPLFGKKPVTHLSNPPTLTLNPLTLRETPMSCTVTESKEKAAKALAELLDSLKSSENFAEDDYMEALDMIYRLKVSIDHFNAMEKQRDRISVEDELLFRQYLNLLRCGELDSSEALRLVKLTHDLAVRLKKF
jgi:predicted DNA-binding protein (UPF0278 family)